MPEPHGPIRLCYRLGPSDVVRALELHTACPGLMAILGWAVSAGVLALLAEQSGREGWIVVGLLALGAVLATFVVAVPAYAAWRWHRARGFFTRHELTLDDEGVEFARGDRSARLPWPSVQRWRESAQQFLLYQNRAEFVVVPKHAFASVADLSAFKRALERHLGPPGRRGAPAGGSEPGEWHASR